MGNREEMVQERGIPPEEEKQEEASHEDVLVAMSEEERRVYTLLAVSKFFPELVDLDLKSWADPRRFRTVLDEWVPEDGTLEGWKCSHHVTLPPLLGAIVYGVRGVFNPERACLEGELLMNTGVRIECGAHLAGPSVLLEAACIARRALVVRSVIGERTQIGVWATVQSALIGPDCSIGAHALLLDDMHGQTDQLQLFSFSQLLHKIEGKPLCKMPHARFGPVLGPGVVIGPGCMIGPGVIIEAGSRLKPGLQLLEPGYYPRALFERTPERVWDDGN